LPIMFKALWNEGQAVGQDTPLFEQAVVLEIDGFMDVLENRLRTGAGRPDSFLGIFLQRRCDLFQLWIWDAEDGLPKSFLHQAQYAAGDI
jgi:hypothetical protein